MMKVPATDQPALTQIGTKAPSRLSCSSTQAICSASEAARWRGLFGDVHHQP
jgi:hypothetical protein